MRWLVWADRANQMIEHLGDSVMPRTSSIKALEAFCAQPHKFDLVISARTKTLKSAGSRAEMQEQFSD